MKKFKGKYRIGSHRKPNWDYSAEGLYFLTIVTQNRVCNLGKIEENKMILSNFGKIVQNEFVKSFEIRKELFLDEYVIMPNHLHLLVEIRDTGEPRASVETHGRAFPQGPRNMPIRLPKSISSFMAGFKSAVNTQIDNYIDEHQLPIPKYNRKNHFFQSNYHDHVVRNSMAYRRIKNYIINNPKKWKGDKLS